MSYGVLDLSRIGLASAMSQVNDMWVDEHLFRDVWANDKTGFEPCHGGKLRYQWIPTTPAQIALVSE